MSQNMEIEVNDGELHARAITGQKQWVAVIEDTHDKYNYDRSFVAYQKPRTSNRDSGRVEIEEGAVIENVNYSHSGKTRLDHFYQVADGELHSIDESDVEDALEEIIVDVDNDNNDTDTERPATTLEEAGIDTDNDNNTDEEVVADGGEEQSNNDVDVHAYDINPLELDYKTDHATITSDAAHDNKTYHFKEIKGTDGLYCLYATWPTPAGEETGWALKGIGRVNVKPLELDVDNIKEYLREEAAEKSERVDVDADVIHDNIDEIAEQLKLQWEGGSRDVLGDALLSNEEFPLVDGSRVYGVTHNSIAFEADEVMSDYDAGLEKNSVARDALRREVSNHTPSRSDTKEREYAADIEFDVESWELRALELQQNAGFPRKMSQTVAVNEEESMKRDVAERLGVSSSTVTEHLQNAAKRVEEAQWTVRNVDL